MARNATSSSPQLAGITALKPAARHACASCTGVAGAALSTASVPRISIEGTVVGTAGANASRADADSRESQAMRKHARRRAPRAVSKRGAVPTNCQERPRHCNRLRCLKKRGRMAAEQQPAISNRLAPATTDALLAYAARATWPAGFVIYQRGAPADGLFIVLEGRVVLRSRVRAGRGFIPWIATPCETFGAEGLSATPRYATEARADEEAATLFLSSAKYRSFMREQPQYATALLAQVLSERSALLEKLRELTTMSVEQRLIVALARMATFDTFTRDDGCIVLSTSRYRLLCELVGATRESVSLVLGRFAGEGLIERKGSSLIVQPSQLMNRMEELPLDDLLAVNAPAIPAPTVLL
jgi:CRP/FNR family cyclic AMP-dependent transcriptional regulator